MAMPSFDQVTQATRLIEEHAIHGEPVAAAHIHPTGADDDVLLVVEHEEGGSTKYLIDPEGTVNHIDEEEATA